MDRNDELLRALIRASSDAVYRMNADWTELHLLDDKGFLADMQSASETWQKYVHRDDHLRVLAAIDEATRNKGVFELEHRIRRRDGTFGRALSRAVPLLNAEGEIIEWLGTTRDVTPRKRAEAEAQAIMDVAPVAVYIARDPQCRKIIGNRMASEFLRVPPGTNLSKSAPEDQLPRNFCVARDGIEIPAGELPIQKAAATGQPVHNCEVDVVYSDGESRSVLGNAVPIFDDDGLPRGAVGTFLDITDLKRTERALAEEARLKDEFLGRLGHELRNPLAAISFASELLSSASDERRTSLEEAINHEVQVLRRLVDDLLDLARITYGKIELRKERIDLAEFLQRMTGFAQAVFVERGQQMILRLPAETVLFMADGIRLEQIIHNLLNNASRYTHRGGTIELSGAKEGSDVVIRCKDDGAGIPLEMQERILDVFVRVEMAGNDHGEGGLGVGLSLVKELAELHGGGVSVRSDGPGKGSEFVVRLPLVKPTAGERGRHEATPAHCRPSLSIVVVEDDRYVAMTTKIALEKWGHQVTVFADGPSALAGTSDLKLDSAIIDIGLPGMNGYELAQQLREKRNCQNALLIAISGRKRDVIGRARGVFDHQLLKPVDIVKLLNLLDRRRPRSFDGGRGAELG